jgi:phosphosulfolactate phosphohydrolase-like enzyme
MNTPNGAGFLFTTKRKNRLIAGYVNIFTTQKWIKRPEKQVYSS